MELGKSHLKTGCREKWSEKPTGGEITGTTRKKKSPLKVEGSWKGEKNTNNKKGYKWK